MKKRFVAVYDRLFYSIISAIMMIIFVVIFVYGDFNSEEWLISHWYLIVIQIICCAVPVAIKPTMQKITIDLNSNEFKAFYLVNIKKNSMDIQSNWFFSPSEVESVELVKLSKEEKKKYTSAKFLFDRYLKVNFEDGNSKYIYVSHYSDSQIIEIAKMLKRKKV